MIVDHVLDVTGLTCPMPLLKAKQELNKMVAGEILRVVATDAGTKRDFQSFMSLSCHELIDFSEDEGVYQYLIRKGVVGK